MPGQPPPEGPDDRTVLHALPEDQPDSLSEGHTSNQADIDKNTTRTSRPEDGALKSEWVDYAESQGVDVDGLTKDQIKNEVA